MFAKIKTDSNGKVTSFSGLNSDHVAGETFSDGSFAIEITDEQWAYPHDGVIYKDGKLYVDPDYTVPAPPELPVIVNAKQVAALTVQLMRMQQQNSALSQAVASLAMKSITSQTEAK